MALALIVTGVLMSADLSSVVVSARAMGYESKLFNTSKVHEINIIMDDWDGFIETAVSEEYTVCSVVIDGEAYKNVAIRAKGNTSLSQVSSYGNNRYSFKIEFDKYDSSKTYYGLDKLCLNNIIQDNTYMKDYSDDNFESYSNIFDNAKTTVTDADKTRLIASLKNINENTNIEESVNVEQVIRYFVVHNFVLNFDSYTGSMIHNYYLYENDGMLSMIPWDYNLAFGGFQSASDATSLVNYPIDSPVSGGDVSSRPMLAWIFESEEYTNMYHEYFAQFISDYFDSGKFEEEIDKVKEMISPYVEADATKFCTYDEFITGIDTLKEFCLLRAKSITGQLDGTIGSTSQAQTSKENFVDASDISVSAMGSMGNTMGAGNKGDFSKDSMTNIPEKPDGNPGDNSAMKMPETSTQISETTTAESS